MPGVELSQIRGDHEIAVGREKDIVGESEADALREPPALQVHGVGALVEQLDVLLPHILGVRMIHDFIDDDIRGR